MHKGELANINPPRITTEPKKFTKKAIVVNKSVTPPFLGVQQTKKSVLT